MATRPRKRAPKKATPRVHGARWHPHLSFDGDCKAAFTFYQRCLGGQVSFALTYGESTLAGQVPRAFHGKILHATFTLGDQVLTGADVLPGDYGKPRGSWIMLHLAQAAEADRVFDAFATKGEVELAIAPTFWASRFGMVKDRFGTPWIVQSSVT
ncbi:MAG TPA: VOC family protein [Planctomycetota bacterium]|nr:VOC family protein [Planctomycetota bacterium]